MGTVSSTEYLSSKIEICGNKETNPCITRIDRLALSSSRTGDERPNWRQVVAEGGNATTNLTATRQTASDSGGYWTASSYNTAQKKYYTSSSNQQGVYLSLPSTEVTASLINEAKSKSTTKANEILAGLLNEFSGQQFLGELKETKNLLLHPLKNSIELIKALMTQKKLAKNAAQSWLEFQFGIRPLLNDIDAISRLIRGQIEKGQKLSFRAYGTANSSSSSSTSGYTDGVFGYLQTVQQDIILRAECSTRFGISKEYLEDANRIKTDWTSSFDRVSQVPITVWELIPYSWLVDYVVNIGDIISAATVGKGGVTYVSRSVITTSELIRTGTTSVQPNDGRFNLLTNVPRRFTSKIRNVNRDGAPIGIPSVVWSLPGSNIRYLNIAALVVLLTSRRS